MLNKFNILIVIEKIFFSLLLRSLTWPSVYHDINLDHRSQCGSQNCRIHSSFPPIRKLMSVSLCCKLSKQWRREKKLLDCSSGRGCTDMSFPDIFTVLAELPCWNRSQNVTSSPKPEQTQQPVISLVQVRIICQSMSYLYLQSQTTAENAYMVCISSITVSQRVTKNQRE